MSLWVLEWIQRTVSPAARELFLLQVENCSFGGVSSRPVLIIPREMLPSPDMYLRLLSASSLPFRPAAFY